MNAGASRDANFVSVFWAHSRITFHASNIRKGMSMASEFSEMPQYLNFFDSSTGERKPLHDVLNEHINGCQKCQETSQKPPNGLGQPSQLCFEYQDLIQDWSELEGEVNNIVAHDEYGNDAPRSGDPRKETPWHR